MTLAIRESPKEIHLQVPGMKEPVIVTVWHDRLDVRHYYWDRGEKKCKPTKKGISIPRCAAD